MKTITKPQLPRRAAPWMERRQGHRHGHALLADPEMFPVQWTLDPQQGSRDGLPEQGLFLSLHDERDDMRRVLLRRRIV